MIPSGGFSLAGARSAFEVTYGGTRPPLLRFESIRFQGGGDGTRTFALAARCAHPGDHSVVVVLRPLTNRGGMNEVYQLANALLTVVFAAAMCSGPLRIESPRIPTIHHAAQAFVLSTNPL
jgi:hypothetical protein